MAFSFFRRKMHQLRDELRRVRRFRKLPDRLASFEEAWERHLPAFLNAVSSVGAMGYELRRQRLEIADHRKDVEAKLSDMSKKISDRIEALRTEALTQFPDFTMHQSNSVVCPDENDPQARPGSASAANFHKRNGDAVNLKLGSAHTPLDGYLTVDTRPLPGVDIVSDFSKLPFDARSVAEIYSHHVLERFTRESLCGTLLPYWRSLLRPGGTFRVVVSDVEAMAAALGAGEISFEEFRGGVLGDRKGAKEVQYDLFSSRSLVKILEEAGFDSVEFVSDGLTNDERFEIEIVARNVSVG